MDKKKKEKVEKFFLADWARKATTMNNPYRFILLTESEAYKMNQQFSLAGESKRYVKTDPRK